MEDVAGSCLKQSLGTWDITIITDNCGRTDFESHHSGK